MKGRTVRTATAGLVALVLLTGGQSYAAERECGDVVPEVPNGLTTTDALAVLKKAVGRDMELTCALECEHWEANHIVSGPEAPWWARGPVSWCDDGWAFATLLEEYNSFPDVFSSLLPEPVDGVFEIPPIDFRGAIDSHGTVFVATHKWTDEASDTTELSVWLKGAKSGGDAYSGADLSGTWELNALETGDEAPWWTRGPIAVNSDGSFAGTLHEYDGSSGPVAGTVNLSLVGVISSTDVGEDFRGAMDMGRTLIVGTHTHDGVPNTTSMTILAKMGDAYALADLAGEWDVHLLASGPAAPWFGHGPVTIASNGAFTFAMVDSDGNQDEQSGTFSITAGGVVTISTSENFRAVMDEGKTVIVGTDTWPSGTSQLSVMVKKGS